MSRCISSKKSSMLGAATVVYLKAPLIRIAARRGTWVTSLTIRFISHARITPRESVTMKRPFSGLATTLKLSAGLTILPHSSIY